jgi:hypothetical protein
VDRSAPPQPRPEDVEAFTAFLRDHGVDPVIREKIRATSETLPSFVSSSNPSGKFAVLGKVAHLGAPSGTFVWDFGDYRLTYDAGANRD